MTTLESCSSAHTIARFATAGGKVLASGRLADKIRERGSDTDVAAIFADLRARGALTHLPDAGKPEVTAAVETIARPRPDVSLGEGPSWNAVTRCDDAWRIAAFNDRDDTRRLTIAIGAGPIEVVRWDIETGAVSAATANDEGLLRLDLPPHTVVCLSIQSSPAESLHRRPTIPPPIEPQPLPGLPLPITLGDGWLFTTRDSSDAPRLVDVTRGWEVQSHATFAGTGIYIRATELPPLDEGLAWHLVLPRVHETVECRVDGVSLGRRIAGDRTFALPGSWRTAAIELHVRNTAANRYYAGTPYAPDVPEPSGLAASPRLEARRVGRF
ncbi:MAG: hypothetical protein H7Y08_06760 [Rhizobiaceae bacterium]|nr:hypothetical protein [Rhizobiaceae bacterium]